MSLNSTDWRQSGCENRKEEVDRKLFSIQVNQDFDVAEASLFFYLSAESCGFFLKLRIPSFVVTVKLFIYYEHISSSQIYYYYNYIIVNWSSAQKRYLARQYFLFQIEQNGMHLIYFMS